MHDDKPDQFVDELLDASLKRYRGEEPRPGLEMRILAGVRSRQSAVRRRGFVWAVAACAGVLAIVVLALHFARAPVRHPAPTASLPRAIANPPHAPGSADPRLRGPRLVRASKEQQRLPKPGVRVINPARPEQFPTPMPLTEQENLLLAYVKIATKPDAVAETNKTDEAPSGDLDIPSLQIAGLEIKPLDDSESEHEN